MDIIPFTLERSSDLIDTINAATANWPHCRPIGPELLAYWQTSRPEYRPKSILMSYADDCCTGILHGELLSDVAHIHLIALRPDPSASDTGAALVREFERIVRGRHLRKIISPTWRASLFYGGYILGNEPYHPHWATAATDAYLRNGFRISHPALILTCDLPGGSGASPDCAWGAPPQAEVSRKPALTASAPAPLLVPPSAFLLHPSPPMPPGYQIVEVTPSPEYGAQTFGFHAMHNGTKAAHCYARLYPHLPTSNGRSTGQIGNVTTEPDHRNRGLARIMVAMSLQRLTDMGAGQCLIATGLDNEPALRAYERCGFVRKHFIMEWSKLLK